MIHTSIFGLECDFATSFCRFGVQRIFPTDHHLAKFRPGEGGMGGGATRIRGLEEFDDTYLEFGLGTRFYDRFLQIFEFVNTIHGI